MAVVLVAGAAPGAAEPVRSALEPVGYRVVEVDRLREPIEAELVLLDLASDPNALDVVRRLKSSPDESVSRVRVGVLAATGSEHERLEAAIEGVVLYVARPIDGERLRRDVVRLLAGEPEPVQRKHVQDAALRALTRLERSTRVAGDRRDDHTPGASDTPPPLQRRLGDLNDRQLAVIEAIAASSTREEARLRLRISRSLFGATLRSAAHRLHFASVSDLVAAVRWELTGEALDHDTRRSMLFQPIVSVATGRPLALAATAWTTTAEGLHESVTGALRWPVPAALDAAARWRTDDEWADVAVFVDVSGRRLSVPGTADDILATVDETGLPPEAVVIEVAETLDVAVSEPAVGAWQALRRAGVRLCVDHFGTERSPLNSLLHLEADAVKLDASLLDVAVAEAAHLADVVAFARAFAPVVVADGVDRADRLRTLETAGCTAVQGPLIGAPAPAPTGRVAVSSPASPSPSPLGNGAGDGGRGSCRPQASRS